MPARPRAVPVPPLRQLTPPVPLVTRHAQTTDAASPSADDAGGDNYMLTLVIVVVLVLLVCNPFAWMAFFVGRDNAVLSIESIELTAIPGQYCFERTPASHPLPRISRACARVCGNGLHATPRTLSPHARGGVAMAGPEKSEARAGLGCVLVPMGRGLDEQR